MWAGQQVSLDVDRGAIVKAECSCGGEVGLCQHQLATVRKYYCSCKRVYLFYLRLRHE